MWEAKALYDALKENSVEWRRGFFAPFEDGASVTIDGEFNLVAVAAALSASRAAIEREVVERCAQIADSFTCGGCGMDGKAGTAIRALAPAVEKDTP